MGKKKSVEPAQSKAENFVNHQRRKYANEWDASSENLASQAVYEWMAEQLGTTGFVLEIGAGTGRSTLELQKRGNKVISVEENPNCLSRTRRAIEAAGYKVVSVPRGTIRPIDSSYHAISYREIKQLKSEDWDVLLIEGNVIRDDHLVKFLKAVGQFDAVVCWLIGGHGAMRFNRSIDFEGVDDPSEYRLFVQNTVYELADELVKSGGVLHVVDRAFGVTPAMIDDWLRSHRDQATGTSLAVEPIESRPYREASADGAMGMGISLPSGELKTNFSDTFLISVRSVKGDAKAG